MTSFLYEEITAEETDILQEVMNIAFGKASADLAEVIDIYVVLNIPEISVMKATDIPCCLAREISRFDKISIVHQNYWGKFKGTAILVFPAKAGRELATLLDNGPDEGGELLDPAEMERDTLTEVGNILIGACVGKVAELLDDVITFSPPRILVDEESRQVVPAETFDARHSAILLKTLFTFEERDAGGFLFLLPNSTSFGWLKKALHTFMEQYL